MILIELARSVFYDQNEHDNLFKMSSIRSHLLHLTKTDFTDSYNELIRVISYKTKRDCLSQDVTKR